MMPMVHNANPIRSIINGVGKNRLPKNRILYVVIIKMIAIAQKLLINV